MSFIERSHEMDLTSSLAFPTHDEVPPPFGVSVPPKVTLGRTASFTLSLLPLVLLSFPLFREEPALVTRGGVGL